jgi:threonyl-tRNA synthetase
MYSINALHLNKKNVMETTKAKDMLIKLLNSNEEIELPEGSTAKDLAIKLNLTGPNQGLAVKINSKTFDLTHPLKDQDEVYFWEFSDPEGKEIFWHTSAHVLAQAIGRLFPDAQPTIGPPIENGFYYDFANLEISDSDFSKIEKEMKKIASENHKPKLHRFANKEEAIEAFKDNPYKVEIINDLPDGEPLTAYEQGDFFDLCRGPHLPQLGKIKAIKVMKTSGAYWRGNAENTMLTRIYACSFPDKTQLKDYLTQLEEAKKRDHKVVGPRLDLFSLKEEAPGMPFIHPKGMIIWNELINYWKDVHTKAGYSEIKTPTMMTRELWEKSGHWTNYRENMFTSQIEERDFAIKPMNCPGCILFYKSTVHSYKEFPLRIAEIGHVHRYEPSGAISGLFRVRSFHQDDAHVFLTPDLLESEIVKIIELCEEIYKTFDLEYHLELSTRPEKNTIGSDEDWELSTNSLRNALEKSGKEFRVNEGDGAFYGPKIDMHLKDALGRTWQCGTIQVDMALPEKFDLEYVANDGNRKRPVMIHRALYGSVERFFGSLIEHYGGRFPLWLSPRQISILTVADRHIDFANDVASRLRAENFHVELNDNGESVNKKVREAQLNQVNYMITIGDSEVENKNISLRTRRNQVIRDLNLDKFIEEIKSERTLKKASSPFNQE